jgi:hypothetical protein
MSVRVFRSSTSHPSLDWERAPIIRPGGLPPRTRVALMPVAAAFLVGFLIGLLI